MASQTGSQRMGNTERLQRALAMRRGGATFQMIADAGLYSSESSAHRAVMNYLKRLRQKNKEMVEAMQHEEGERIDEMLRSVWDVATDPTAEGHLQAVDRVIKLIRERCRIFGLCEPEKKEITGSGGERLLPEGLNFSGMDGETLEQARQLLESGGDESQ